MTRLVVLDIETLPTSDPEVLREIEEEQRGRECAKSASKAAKEAWAKPEAVDERVREAIAKTAVDPLLAEVVCVVTALEHGEPEAWLAAAGAPHRKQGPEEAALYSLSLYLHEVATPETIWVGHNLQGFDLPVLLNRLRRWRIQPPRDFPTPISAGRWRGRIFDTMLRTPARTPFVSMDAACRAYGVNLRPILWDGEPMDGSRVAQCVAAKEWGILRAYCEEDVLATRSLYRAATFGDSWGTWPHATDLVERLEEIERDSTLSEGQKALSQKALLVAAGAWPK